MKYNKPFQKFEYELRIKRTKQRMENVGFDLLICQDPANLGWLTGFDGWSFYTPQAVLVHLEETDPIWFGRAQDAKSAQITTNIPDKNIIGYSDEKLKGLKIEPFLYYFSNISRTEGINNSSNCFNIFLISFTAS